MPYGELDGMEYVAAAQARLMEVRDRTRELRVAAVLAQGRAAEVLGELTALTHELPLRERLWGLRALALYRCGRQGDALAALRTARRTLTDELGVDPGEELTRIEADILAQAPALRTPVPAARPRGAVRVREQAVSAPAYVPERFPLMGRTAELAAVDGVLAGVGVGTPGFVLITGEAGIGKTRLAEEIATRARELGWAVAVGRCAATEGAPAFWPWTTVLSSLIDATTELPADVADNLPGAGAAEGSRFQIYHATARALAAVARRRPVVVILDDLHWADASSLRLLRYLTDVVDGDRIMVVGAVRGRPPPTGALADAFEGFARRHAVRLALTGLTTDELAGIVPAEAATPETLRVLRERTGGNPFFVTELVRLTSNARDLRDALPLGVRDVVLGRIARLPADTADLLRVAAVAGREFDAQIVAAAAGLRLDETLDRLEPAFAAALVNVDGRPSRFRFGHPLVQEAVADALSPVRRARLHARVAESLDGRAGDSTADRLAVSAHHWLLAAPAGHARRSWQAARRAACAAAGLRAHDVAVEFLERALEVIDGDSAASPAERMDLLLELANARIGTGDVVSQRSALDEVRRLATRAGDRGRLVIAATGAGGWNMRPWIRHGWWDPELVTTLAELAADEDLDDVTRCRVLGGLAAESYYRPGSDPAWRERLTARSVALARASGDPTLLGWALHTRYLAIWVPDMLDERLAVAAEMVDVGRASGNAELAALGLAYRSSAFLEALRFDAAVPLLEEAAGLADRLRAPRVVMMVGWIRLGLAVLSGDLPAAERLLAATGTLHRSISLWGAEEAIVCGTLQLMLARGGRGEVDAKFLAQLGAAANGPVEDSMRDIHALVLIMAGRAEEARRLVGSWDEQRPIPRTLYWPVMMGIRAAVRTGLGDRGACKDLYGALAPYAGRMVMGGTSPILWPMSRSLCLLAGVLGRHDAAVEHGEHALRTCSELGSGGLVAIIAGETARARRARGGSGDADRAAELDAIATRAAERTTARVCVQTGSNLNS